jgi:FAD/FMN-containing dehydrogenase
MWADFYETLTEAQLPSRPRPMATGHGIYALVEAMGGNAELDGQMFEGALASLMEEGLLSDAVIAQSDQQREALWAVREDLSPGFTPRRPFTAYDVSMAIADMPRFVDAALANLKEAAPDATALFYGHAGDGNLHANVSNGKMDESIKRTFDTAIYRAVSDLGGSISAEHGIGMDRLSYIGMTRSSEELALMRTIKRAIDPKGILNPGKVFEMEG